MLSSSKIALHLITRIQEDYPHQRLIDSIPYWFRKTVDLITNPICTDDLYGAMLNWMSEEKFYLLTDLTVVDVIGADAAAIVNNLTTNEVINLRASNGRESFVTDVRGKTLGHVALFNQDNRIRMIGPTGQSQSIVDHVERYTIREDATPQICDDQFCGIVLTAKASVLHYVIDESGETIAEPIAHFCVSIAGKNIDAYRTRWLGDGTVVLLVSRTEVEAVTNALVEMGLAAGDVPSFHRRRIEVGFPWYGIDLDPSNLPQELDRDDAAISFTKGCYLGQETVARLDALGQVQRKLVRWQIANANPPAGTTLESEGKTVARLTSVATGAGEKALALGYARRSHFDSGATATGIDPTDGAEFTARVL